LLRKITSQPEMEPGTFRFSGGSVLVTSTIEACDDIYRNN